MTNMKPQRRLRARGAILVAGLIPLSLLLAIRTGQAQEAIEIPNRDRPLESAFEEVFRIGVADGRGVGDVYEDPQGCLLTPAATSTCLILQTGAQVRTYVS